MITITYKYAITVAYKKTTKYDKAYATCRMIKHSHPDCQEWAAHCEIEGVPAKVYYIFRNDECEGSDMPWDSEHVSKIEIAEKDEDGKFEKL